jgi:hypothetical protein
MTNRRSAFLAEHKRQPIAAEERQLAEQVQADRRAAEATRHELELRRAFLDTPGATPEQWEQEKAAILATDRAERAVKGKDAARRSQCVLYRTL